MPRVRLYGPKGFVWSHHTFLPLKPLDYQLIYAAHHLYPSFLYIQGFEGTVRLLSTTRGQSGKGQNLTHFSFS